MKRWALIVGAGRGARAGFEINKVYMPLGDSTVLETCLRAFDESGLFDGITVVISKEDEARFNAIGRPKSVKNVVYGGTNRQESVYNGLKSVDADADIVSVHDAARPFVTREIIEATINGAEAKGSGVISTPVTDTIKMINGDGSVTTPERNALFAVQTPQTFDMKKLLAAHRRAREENFLTTDDAALFEKYYGTVNLVRAPGAEHNQKLTYRSDFDMYNPDIRVGYGYDAHRLVEGRRLILCGVDVPHTLGLDGHSDADVAVHALMDAMLGAAALGDIGRHFPDSDERYRGISSMLLLKHVCALLAENGYRVSNADITIIAQKPRLAPCIAQMSENVASVLGLDVRRVNIKATTTEKMGFEGACEGISSHAVVTIIGKY